MLYLHRQLQAQRDALADLYAITDDDRLVAAFGVFALFGAALGISSAVPDMDLTAPATLTATALAEAVVRDRSETGCAATRDVARLAFIAGASFFAGDELRSHPSEADQ